MSWPYMKTGQLFSIVSRAMWCYSSIDSPGYAVCFPGGNQTDSSDETQKVKKDRIPPGTVKLVLKETRLLW